jgi:hypothetical protein
MAIRSDQGMAKRDAGASGAEKRSHVSGVIGRTCPASETRFFEAMGSPPAARSVFPIRRIRTTGQKALSPGLVLSETENRRFEVKSVSCLPVREHFPHCLTASEIQHLRRITRVNRLFTSPRP